MDINQLKRRKYNISQKLKDERISDLKRDDLLKERDSIVDLLLKLKYDVANVVSLKDLINNRKQVALEFDELQTYLDKHNITEYNFFINKEMKLMEKIEKETILGEKELIKHFEYLIKEIKESLEGA